MKAEDFIKRKQQADADNSLPDINGNNLIFGERQQCINPTLLNAKRESLGYRPKLQSAFFQCQTRRIKR